MPEEAFSLSTPDSLSVMDAARDLPESYRELSIAMSTELGDQVYSRIKSLCSEGDILAERRSWVSALAKYEEGLMLLPEPSSRWEASTWILTAIGDVAFLSGQFERARDALTAAVACPNGVGNPFIHLRLGQAHLELGNEILAADELARAYMGGGKNIFDDEDPKYFGLIKSRLRPPPTGW